MRRSKLEIHIDILEALAFKGQLRLTYLMYKSKVNCCLLREQLEFLIKNGLVEEKMLEKRTIYAITSKGLQVLKTFREIKEVFPLEEGERPQRPPLF
jgi:predicted transcriptional regulator